MLGCQSEPNFDFQQDNFEIPSLSIPVAEHLWISLHSSQLWYLRWHFSRHHVVQLGKLLGKCLANCLKRKHKHFFFQNQKKVIHLNSDDLLVFDLSNIEIDLCLIWILFLISLFGQPKTKTLMFDRTFC